MLAVSTEKLFQWQYNVYVFSRMGFSRVVARKLATVTQMYWEGQLNG